MTSAWGSCEVGLILNTFCGPGIIAQVVGVLAWVLSSTTSASGKTIYICNLNHQRWGQEDQVFGVSLGYVLRLRPLWTIWDPVSTRKEVCNFSVLWPFIHRRTLNLCFITLNSMLGFIATHDIWCLILFQESIVADTAFLAVFPSEVICSKRLKLSHGHATLSAWS